ncbi:MAG: hypothetical protein AB7T49_08525 [Oligoflexales bacterium]
MTRMDQSKDITRNDIPMFDSSTSRDEILGTDIKAYAAKHQLKEREIWERVKSGEIVARSQNGKLYIYEKDELRKKSPLPEHKETPSFVGAFADKDPAELTLFLDHLSLAKEENKEILKLTQASIQQITDLSQSLLTSKDEMIKTKSNQIAILQEKVRRREKIIIQLRQEIEDLKMLNKTLSSSNLL